MRLIIREDCDAVSEYMATYIKNRILEFNPTPEKPFVLGLPTGSSPIGVYKNLVKYHKNGELSFQNVVTFNMDEYVGLPRDHSESYHSFMWHNLFKHVDINPKNVHILNGNAEDLEKECTDFEVSIKAAGGIELFLGAFNEPGSSLNSRTRVKTLAYDTILANSRFFENDISKVPRMALTVGALIVCDEDATLELHVKTVKYFKSIEHVIKNLIGAENVGLQGNVKKYPTPVVTPTREEFYNLPF
ncbi:1567_t:CDS:2 [Entrophospora sp. SA101]|nr:17204_t:CDS:2 [Entrophospora sp. SA101]CAJ0764825.1 1567_t:CDS:2 [Entrophospora sp. SA101]